MKTDDELLQVATLACLHAILSRPFSAGALTERLVEDAIEAAREYVRRMEAM
jgi:hypothetical protein